MSMCCCCKLTDSHSVFNLFYGLDFFRVVKLFLVVFKRLRELSAFRNGRSLVELVLHCLIHAKSSIDQLILSLVHGDHLLLSMLHLVDEQHFVVVELALVPLHIHLLDPHPSVIHFLFGRHTFIERSLSLSHSSLALLLPRILERFVFVFLLLTLALLPLLNSIHLFLFSFHVELMISIVLFSLLFLFLFDLLSLEDIFFKL